MNPSVYRTRKEFAGGPPRSHRRITLLQRPLTHRRVVGASRCTIRPYFAPCWHLSVTAGRNDAPPRRRPGEYSATRKASLGTSLGTRSLQLLFLGLDLVAELLDLFLEVLDL